MECFATFFWGITHITQKMCLKWVLDLVGIRALLNQSGEDAFHPDGINHSILPNKQNCQLFLSFWATLLPPVFFERKIYGNSLKSYGNS